MKQLALVTWRLPHADLDRLERTRSALAGLADRSDVFAFTTCQRSLACTLADEPQPATEALLDEIGLRDAERYAGADAFAHLARVAASLDALIPGEDQVPAQFREALADEEAKLEPALHQRLQRVRSVARKARDTGGLTGHESRSILDLAEPLLPDEGPLAVLGTGTIAREAVDRLDEDRAVHVVSRSRARATDLAGDAARAWSRETFLADPPAVAGLVLSTRAPEEPIVDEADAQRLLAARERDQPLALVDLGVPRNADTAITRLPDASLTTVEDLAHVARCSPEDDERVSRARAALQEALQAERRRRRRRRLDERVVALREELADELEDLAADGDLDARLDRVHGSLAHTAQRHLEAALQGDPPP